MFSEIVANPSLQVSGCRLKEHDIFATLFADLCHKMQARTLFKAPLKCGSA